MYKRPGHVIEIVGQLLAIPGALVGIYVGLLTAGNANTFWGTIGGILLGVGIFLLAELSTIGIVAFGRLVDDNQLTRESIERIEVNIYNFVNNTSQQTVSTEMSREEAIAKLKAKYSQQ